MARSDEAVPWDCMCMQTRRSDHLRYLELLMTGLQLDQLQMQCSSLIPRFLKLLASQSLGSKQTPWQQLRSG